MKIHIVQKGDTLWEIAKKYGVDFEQLKDLNSHLASPDMIMPGMKIRIPTQSKKITKGDKTQVLPKQQQAPQKAYPPPKKEVKIEEKSLELPKMPTFPMDQEDTLPIMEGKKQEYPTKILPELPKAPEYKPAPQPQPKQEPQQISPPPQYVAPAHDDCMPLMGMPAYPQPQMYPVMPCPSHGYMPISYDPCGCGGGQGYPMPMHGMQQPMFQPYGVPMQPGNMGYPATMGMQYGYPGMQQGYPGMQQAYPNPSGQQMGSQGGQQQGMNQSYSPQMYPGMGNQGGQMNIGQDAYQQPTENGLFYSNQSLRMFPEPPRNISDSDREDTVLEGKVNRNEEEDGSVEGN